MLPATARLGNHSEEQTSMSLVIRVIVGFVIGAVGMSLAMTSRIARDGTRSISFSSAAAFAQDDSGEAAPAMPEAAPPIPESPPPMPEAAPPIAAPQGAAESAPDNSYNSGSAAAQAQSQEDQARQAVEMQQQADQLREQQEQMKQMINNMR